MTHSTGQTRPLMCIKVMAKYLSVDILSNTGLYLVVLGQKEQGVTGCQCDMLSENIWFTWCKPSNSSIFGEGKSDYGQTHTQTHRHTDRQNFLSKTRPLLWKGSSKNGICNSNSKFGMSNSPSVAEYSDSNPSTLIWIVPNLTQ